MARKRTRAGDTYSRSMARIKYWRDNFHQWQTCRLGKMAMAIKSASLDGKLELLKDITTKLEAFIEKLISDVKRLKQSINRLKDDQFDRVVVQTFHYEANLVQKEALNLKDELEKWLAITAVKHMQLMELNSQIACLTV